MSLKYLADTHVLLWALNQPQRLSRGIRSILEDEATTVCYSSISLWEIAIKHGLGKLDLLGHSPEEFLAELERSFFVHRPLDPHSLISSYHLPSHHRDPFDRMLIWEAIRNNLVLLSADGKSDAYAEDGLKVAH
jgi:PIN domain nuclease of toxin-antitoxin system